MPPKVSHFPPTRRSLIDSLSQSQGKNKSDNTPAAPTSVSVLWRSRLCFADRTYTCAVSLPVSHRPSCLRQSPSVLAIARLLIAHAAVSCARPPCIRQSPHDPATPSFAEFSQTSALHTPASSSSTPRGRFPTVSHPRGRGRGATASVNRRNIAPATSSSPLPGPASSGSGAGQSPAQSPAETTVSLAQGVMTSLHILCAKFPQKSLLPPSEREASHHRDILSQRFPGQHAQRKFVLLLQAIITVCTSDHGPNNVAVLMGLTEKQVRLYISQNAGNWQDLHAHLHRIWRVLQDLGSTVGCVAPPPSNPVTPPRVLTASEAELTTKLLDFGYDFAFRKAVHRVKKKLSKLQSLYDVVQEDNTISEVQRTIIEIFLAVSVLASNVPSEKPRSSDTWAQFRRLTADLYDISVNHDYEEDLIALQKLASTIDFDFTKSMDKALKLQSACLTLAHLAISPYRGWISDLPLELIQIQVPKSPVFLLELQGFDEELKQQLRRVSSDPKAMHTVSYATKIHSECVLLAEVLGVCKPLGDIVPYMCCSKLHCFACYTWLGHFNTLRRAAGTDPIAYDGSHGGVKCGWVPPSLENVSQDTMLGLLVKSLNNELRKGGHLKETSTSFTSPDPPASLKPSRTLAEVRASARAALATVPRHS
ncbi:hypothetical protein C8R47DRAFT_338206 [Mycena vitilis]|nr:hypothetical protein C8R47DRAFT_338206 [Mycena vitilis]